MTDFEYLHEAEDVWLVSENTRWCVEIWPILAELGFELDDDVFTVDRAGKTPLWQSRSIVAVYILRGEEEIHDEHSQWDRLKLRYLLATLPADLLGVFVEKAGSLADRLRVPLLHRGRRVTVEELRVAIEGSVRDLRESVGEPGSKEVAAAIETTYPRRN